MMKCHLSLNVFWTYRIFTPIFLDSQQGANGVEDSGEKKRIQNSLVPKTEIVRHKNNLSSLGNLVWQRSHVLVSSNMSACFEFVLRKNKFCIRSRSHDMEVYIFHAFDSLFLSHTHYSRQLDRVSLFYSHLLSSLTTYSYRHTAKNGRTYS